MAGREKIHCSDALQHMNRKIMFKRHIQRTTINHAHEIKAASKLQLRHSLVINTLEYLIKHSIQNNYCFDYCCSKSELCALILIYC